MLGYVNGCVHVWFSASNCCPCSDLPTVTTSHAAECRAHLVDSLRTARATPSRRPKSSNEPQPIEKREPVGALHEGPHRLLTELHRHLLLLLPVAQSLVCVPGCAPSLHIISVPACTFSIVPTRQAQGMLPKYPIRAGAIEQFSLPRHCR